MRLPPPPEPISNLRLYRIDAAGEVFAIVAETEQQAREWYVQTFEAGRDMVDEIREMHDWDKLQFDDPHELARLYWPVPLDGVMRRGQMLLQYNRFRRTAGERRVPDLVWTTM